MDQQFSLTWNNFHGNLSKGFAGLLGNGEFVDVTIAVEGHLLQAHKVILSICSPYFKKMFQINPCQHPIVVIRDVSYKSMKDLLQFMYHGEVSVKREDLTSFIRTAEVLQIKGLTNPQISQGETDDDNERNQKNPAENQIITPEPETCVDPYDTNIETRQNNELEMLKQKQFIEKLQKLNQLKRKSEEFLQNTYFNELLNPEKRTKLKERQLFTPNNLSTKNYEHSKSVYDEEPIDITPTYNSQIQRANSIHDSIDGKDQSPADNSIEVKTECDDSDIIVTDPAVCSPPKSYDSREGKNDLSTSMEYQSPQDSTASLSSLFVDLKNLVEGKVSNVGRNEDYLKQPVEHCLVTIPQKEDGKKKYPQRSCRRCWKIGRRRDTRFMCSACEQPFCKAPCFGIHYNNILKVFCQQGDYSAT